MPYRIIPLVFLFITICDGFFSIELSTINSSNLTCSYYDDVINNCDYCVYQFYSNGSASTVVYDCIQTTNTYKSISRRCEGFSDTTDIGYGDCSPLPFEIFNISILCICTTDMCNQNLTSCQSSVKNQNQPNSTPSPLPEIVRPLVKPISCIDTQNETQTSLSISHYCQYYASPYIDVTKCNAYVVNNTVLCMYIASNGNPSPVAVTEDNYRSVLLEVITEINEFSHYWTGDQFYNETSSYFYVNFNGTIHNKNRIFDRCVCSRDNCNSDLTSCFNANILRTASLAN